MVVLAAKKELSYFLESMLLTVLNDVVFMQVCDSILNDVVFMQVCDSITMNNAQVAITKFLPLVKVVCDDSLNTPERIDKKEFWFSLEHEDIKLICKYHGKKRNIADAINIIDVLAVSGIITVMEMLVKGE